jgi:parallel beta-helix repeat protein
MRQRLRSRLTYANAPATLVSLAVIMVLAIAGLVALSGAEAAGDVSCGDTITTDTTLHRDLVNCPNNGIVIGADDITLDLNYHTIDGDGTPAAGCDPETEFCDIGVLNDGHDGVTVVHGSVRQFDVGAIVGEARQNRLLGISSSRNRFFGIVVFASVRSVVRNGSFSRNIPPEGDGIGLFGCDHLRILHNAIRRNPGPGIHVDDSTENLIKRNLFSRNGPSILLEADRNQVRRNRLIRGGGVVVERADRNVIARNRVSRALDSIAIENGRGNLVARNVVGEARGTGIRLGIQRPPIGGGHNVVRGNRVRRSGDDGFHVYEKDDHSLLKRNVATGAGDDGFDVEGRTTELTRNRALRNADLGIEAIRGVIDGGGNKASGNGDPRECTNIVCS